MNNLLSRPAFTALVFAVFLSLAFGAALWRGTILAFEDGMVQNFPAFAGQEKLWTSYLLCGFPVLADPQVATFYPIMQFCRLFGNSLGYNLYILSGYFIAMLSASALAFQLTKSRFAALVSGLVYGGSGFLISELNHVQILHTTAWLPLILFFIERLKGELSGRFSLKNLAGLFFVCLLSIFAGHPQTCFYGFFLSASYLLLVSSGSYLAYVKRLVLPVLFTFALAIAASAVQILPSMELSTYSARPLFNFSDFIIGQLSPTEFAGFSFPYILGGQYGTLAGTGVVNQGPPPGYLFFGFAPLLLSLFVTVRHWRQPVVRFFALASFLSCLVVLGTATPLATLVFYIPGFGSFRGLYRLLLVVLLAVSMLAAMGIARLEHLATRPGGDGSPIDFMALVKRRGFAKHLAFMTYLIASGLSYNFFLGTVALGIFCLQPRKVFNRLVLVLSVCISLLVYVLNADWTRGCKTAATFEVPFESIVLKEELAQSRSRIFTLKGLEGATYEFPTNICRLWAVPNATGYEPLVQLSYARMLGIAEGGFLQPPWLVKVEDRSFDVASIKYLLAPQVEVTPRLIDTAAHDFWKISKVVRGVIYFENKRALPRFYLIGRAVRIDDTVTAIRTVRHSLMITGRPFDPYQMVILSPEPVGSAGAMPDALMSNDFYSPDGIQLVADKEDALELSVDVPGKDKLYLVVTDQCYPGWVATVDGVESPIYRANTSFRAVELTPGRHTVRMEFKSKTIERGVIISAISLGVFCLFAFLMCARGAKVPR